MERVKKAQPNHFGITSLDESMLSSTIPTRTFPGGTTVERPPETFILFRTTATQRAIGATLGFFLDDSRLEPLWARPDRYGVEFRRFGVGAVVQPDFSLWTDDSLEEQLQSVKKKAIVSRVWQEHGLPVAPCLNWSNEESFPFCFSGIPIGCAVAFTECRTPGANDADRRAFLAGLTEAVKQCQPHHVCVYGGYEHAYWLTDRLPAGPQYTLLEAWTSARGRIRKAERRQLREQNQPELFQGGTETWAEEAVVAA